MREKIAADVESCIPRGEGTGGGGMRSVADEARHRIMEMCRRGGVDEAVARIACYFLDQGIVASGSVMSASLGEISRSCFRESRLPRKQQPLQHFREIAKHIDSLREICVALPNPHDGARAQIFDVTSVAFLDYARTSSKVMVGMTRTYLAAMSECIRFQVEGLIRA